MISFIKKLFGEKTNFKKLFQEQKALVIDVRTHTEYSKEHLSYSQNIPLQDLKSSLHLLKKDRPIITCCASGIRSISAKNILKKAGFEAYDGGSWKSLQKKI